MTQYIDKERVVSLIKERRDAAISRQKNLKNIGDESVLNEMVAFNLDKILEAINSLKMKEVNLEKEIKEVKHNYKVDDNRHTSICSADIEWLAKHFFELGLNFQSDSIDFQNIDDTIKEEGFDPYSKEAKIIKESYYAALEKAFSIINNT